MSNNARAYLAVVVIFILIFLVAQCDYDGVPGATCHPYGNSAIKGVVNGRGICEPV